MNTFEKECRLALWICMFLGLSIIVGVVFFLPGCASTTPKIPPLEVDFWAGDPSKGGITREQDNQTIQCMNPEFERYICTTYEELQKIYELMLECRDWSSLAKTTEKNE